jgi:hypothetical protein
MPPFLQKFFPDVYEQTQNPEPEASPYCSYDNQLLTLFTSSLFLAGLFMSFFAASMTRAYGRKVSLVFASICFMAGTGLNAGAVNLAMLVVGRILLGFGIGAANTSVPLYLSEAAPHKHRGGLNMLFQLAVTIGILAAQLINYGAQDLTWGWRLSLGLAGVPAVLLFVGGLVLPETPNSLAERGRTAEAKAVLQRLRGTQDVEVEMADIVAGGCWLREDAQWLRKDAQLPCASTANPPSSLLSSSAHAYPFALSPALPPALPPPPSPCCRSLATLTPATAPPTSSPSPPPPCCSCGAGQQDQHAAVVARHGHPQVLAHAHRHRRHRHAAAADRHQRNHVLRPRHLLLAGLRPVRRPAQHRHHRRRQRGGHLCLHLLG